MKKFTLLLICAFCSAFAFGQTAIIYASGTAGSYTTGSAEYTASTTAYNRIDDAIKVSNLTANRKRGYAVFDLSAIPAWANVTGVVLGIDISGYAAGTYGACQTYGIAGDLSTITNADSLYNFCGGLTGTLLWNAATITSPGSYGSGVANYVLVSSVAANTFVQTNIGSKVSFTFYSQGTNAYTITGETGPLATSGTHAPYLQVYYTGIPATCGAIIEDSVYAPIDSICDPRFYVKISCSSPTLYLKTYYGDGVTDSVAFTSSGGTSYAIPSHHYPLPGGYTVKQVVYYGGVPTDSIIYTYQHSYCQVFHVKFYPDENTDCVWNSNEHYNTIPVGIRVDSAGIPVATLSATSGLYYHEKGAPGTVYSFRLLPANMYATCPSSGILYDTVRAGAMPYVPKYFGLTCASSDFDLEVIADVIGSGKQTQDVRVYARNNRCFVTNATVVANFSPKYNYTSATPVASHAMGSNTITWNITIPQLAQHVLKYRLDISPFLMPGDSVHSNFLITPISADVIPGNNSEDDVDTVRSSYDPNNVTVTPEGCFDRDTVLHYAVHFENTGNDTAQNIYVMDTLSGNVDISSLKIIAASAEMDVYVFSEGDFHIVKFDFPGIKLLDSSHHGLCHGSVMYTINTSVGLPDGIVITNRAGIYFDDNEVVMTNTTENTKGCPPALSVPVATTNKTELFPNPTTNELTIKTEQDAYNAYIITNSVGQVLIQQHLSGVRTTVNVSALVPGIYYVVLKGEGGNKTMKFVKM